MDSFDKIEAMLAELVEQVNGQKEQSGKVLKKLDGIDERLTRLESVEPPSGEQVSMITLKEHEEKMNEAVAEASEWKKLYTKSLRNEKMVRDTLAKSKEEFQVMKFELENRVKSIRQDRETIIGIDPLP